MAPARRRRRHSPTRSRKPPQPHNHNHHSFFSRRQRRRLSRPLLLHHLLHHHHHHHHHHHPTSFSSSYSKALHLCRRLLRHLPESNLHIIAYDLYVTINSTPLTASSSSSTPSPLPKSAAHPHQIQFNPIQNSLSAAKSLLSCANPPPSRDTLTGSSSNHSLPTTNALQPRANPPQSCANNYIRSCPSHTSRPGGAFPTGSCAPPHHTGPFANLNPPSIATHHIIRLRPSGSLSRIIKNHAPPSLRLDLEKKPCAVFSQRRPRYANGRRKMGFHPGPPLVLEGSRRAPKECSSKDRSEIAANYDDDDIEANHGQISRFRGIIPGGHEMEMAKLLEEAAHYIVSLQIQVEALSCLAHEICQF